MSAMVYPVGKHVDGAFFEIDIDKKRLDRGVIHAFLADSHWARGIPLPVLDRAIDNSLAFGLYRDGRQVGFARVVSDFATVAYLADVFVLAPERGRGLALWLVRTIMAHPDLQGLRRWLLGTRDAHGLYRRCGFSEPAAPFSFLERNDPAVHDRAACGATARRLAEAPASY